MAMGVVGQKLGMMRFFDENGASIPVTVVEAKPNLVTQIKTKETDGYSAVQVAYGEQKQNRVTKPRIGHFSKANVEAAKGLKEFRVEETAYNVGQEIKVDIFSVGQQVDVVGISKGKGFAGAIKRHHFRTQDMTHGNSLSHRAPGSIGQNQTPGRVFKGKKMAGHLGSVQRTAQNLEVMKVDVERHLLLIKGAVPGAPGGNVIVNPSVKTKKPKSKES